MRWFGDSWGAPACEPDQHIDTPVGARCGHCDEDIEDADQGVVLPYVRATDQPVDLLAYHLNCYLRGIFGSVGHQLGQCLCFNADPETRFDDPPGLTPRQAADAAVELWEKQGYVERPFLRP